MKNLNFFNAGVYYLSKIFIKNCNIELKDLLTIKNCHHNFYIHLIILKICHKLKILIQHITHTYQQQ